MIESKPQDIVVYESEDGAVSFNVNLMTDNIWVTQANMVSLFERDQSVIARHIRNIFNEKELDKNSVYAKIAYTASDGKTYKVDHYSLDVVISVGYRVKSKRGIQFRLWASSVLKEYMIQGYALNETRLKQFEKQSKDIEELKLEITAIKGLLLRLSERPIVIHNHNQIGFVNNKLEKKLIELLDSLIESSNQKKIKSTLQEVKDDLHQIHKNPKSKNRLVKFFKNLGDQSSDTYQTISGAGISKSMLEEVYKIGKKLIELFTSF